MRGKLNSFQKTMLQWDELHPYNAVHVAQLPGAFDRERLRLGITATLERNGFGWLTLNRKDGTYSYQPGPSGCEITTVAIQEEPRVALRAEIERQLNTPFDSTVPFRPFRFVALPGKDSFFLVLAYFHAIADAESIVHLLRGLARDYAKAARPEAPPWWNLYPESRAGLLRRHPIVVARRLQGLPAQARNLRRSHRPRYRDIRDLSNGFNLFSLTPDCLRSLVAAGRSWDVTVNDLLLALLLKSVSPLSMERVQAARRRLISAGCIVNLRRDMGVDSSQAFGLFLGSFTVTHAVPQGIALRELAKDISQQTAVVKQHRLALATPMELAFGRFALRFFSLERRKRFYQKNYPLWGGLTNLNLNSLWGPATDEGPIDYFRGVSTGPVTPLVLSVTTAGERVNVGLSYRATVFSTRDIEQTISHFMHELEQLQEGA